MAALDSVAADRFMATRTPMTVKYAAENAEVAGAVKSADGQKSSGHYVVTSLVSRSRYGGAFFPYRHLPGLLTFCRTLVI